MNKRDSSGFDPEFERTQRCSLIEYPRRDLREWIVRLAGGIAGFVHQWGNSRFWALITNEPTLTAAYTNLEQAVRTVEFAHLVRDVCGICGGVRQ
jgi:hypothetical protein